MLTIANHLFGEARHPVCDCGKMRKVLLGAGRPLDAVAHLTLPPPALPCLRADLRVHGTARVSQPARYRCPLRAHPRPRRDCRSDRYRS